jgi:hypothetical protein
MRSPVCADYQRKVWDIAGRRGAMFVVGICRTKVWTRGFKIGRVTFACLMDMNGMLAWGQILDVELDFYAMLGRGERCGADAPAVGVLDIY